MPAFGKDGIVNLNQTKTIVNYKLVQPDGKVVVSSVNKEVLERTKEELSQQLKVELKLVEETVKCI